MGHRFQIVWVVVQAWDLGFRAIIAEKSRATWKSKRTMKLKLGSHHDTQWFIGRNCFRTEEGSKVCLFKIARRKSCVCSLVQQCKKCLHGWRLEALPLKV